MQANQRRSHFVNLDARERKILGRLSAPTDVQAVLDGLTYSSDPWYRSPHRALRDGKAHCYDGAVLGAALLSSLGHPPMIINMFPNSRDDEHLIAPFRAHGAWGAVGKSNFVGLRYREPIHRTLRELVISYFEQYYNVAGEKTMRSYTRPLRITKRRFGAWTSDDDAMDVIADALESMRRYPLLTPQMVRGLAKVDPRSYEAGLRGSVPEGLFRLTSAPSVPSAGSNRRSD